MMNGRTLLTGLRERLAHPWIVVLFGSVYFLSQAIIGVQLEQIGVPAMLELQVQTFTAEEYRSTFLQWQADGLMPFYRSHLIFDSIHWVWYAVALGALMALLMKRTERSEAWNAFLLVPIAAGLCDLLENTLQRVFLDDPELVTIVDPLPAISAAASITKWSLAALALAIIGWLGVLAVIRSRDH